MTVRKYNAPAKPRGADAPTQGTSSTTIINNSGHTDAPDKVNEAVYAERSGEADYAANADESNHAVTSDHAKNLTTDSSDWKTIKDKIDEAIKLLSDVYLSKKKADIAKAVITFLKGIILGENFSINELGNAILSSVKSPDHDISTQSGFSISKRADGKYTMSITDLVIWGKAVFNELEKRIMSFVGGNMVFSAAGSKITRVEKIENAYRCYFLQDDGTTQTRNLWKAGDQARCETANIVDAGGVSANRRYWRLVTNVGKDFVDLSITDNDGNTEAPKAEDVIVQYGNRDNVERQAVIEILISGEDAPAIVWYNGVDGYTLTGKRKAIISPRVIEFDTRIFRIISTDGTGITIEEAARKASTVNPNLFKNSVCFSDLSHWENNGGGIELSNDVLFQGMPTIKTSLHEGISATPDNYIPIEPNKVYTYSAWVYFESDNPLELLDNMPLHFHPRKANGDIAWEREYLDYSKGFLQPRKWTRLFGTFKLTNPEVATFRAIIYTLPNTHGTLYIGSLKFEEGDRVTENVPTTDAILRNAKEYTTSKVTASDKAISLTVEKIGKTLQKAGIDITSGSVAINADTVVIGDENNKTAVFKNGKVKAQYIDTESLTAQRLRTIDTENGRVEIGNALMQVFNPTGNLNIRVGLDRGNSVFEFLNNNGDVTFSIGSRGFINKLVQEMFINVDYYEIARFVTVGNVPTSIPEILRNSDVMNLLFAKNYNTYATTIYQYQAERIGDTYSAGQYGVTQNTAKSHDGIYYLQKNVRVDTGRRVTGLYVDKQIGAAIKPLPGKTPVIPSDYTAYESSYPRAVDFSQRVASRQIYVFTNGIYQPVKIYKNV